ncbi:tRNA splicing endonuclease SEN2 [Trachipleistophora hominis]|uniref:tRNA-intron lyase n=1 Tax=Trachipleistophora hominis TaxID=72359 RepID=L7JST3_TRAHO|nr:tRNA splicing endonuclease SEN2 [Trachipleistophora hominis]
MINHHKKIMRIKSHLLAAGYEVTDGIKYGTDFLIYTHDRNKVHAKYACIVYNKQSFLSVIAVQRVVNGVGKVLIFGDVRDGKVMFWRVERLYKRNDGDGTNGG